MATVQERSKNSYRITVSCGLDSNGKQIRKTKTITFPDDMSKAKQKKKLKSKVFYLRRKCKMAHV